MICFGKLQSPFLNVEIVDMKCLSMTFKIEALFPSEAVGGYQQTTFFDIDFSSSN